MSTPLTNITEIAVNQATKYVTANTAFRILEQFGGGGRVISATTSAEPGSPSDGDAYILPSSPTGTNWASYAQNDLVLYISSSWHVVTPYEGLGPIWVNDTNVRMSYDGSAWVNDAATALGNGVEDLTTAEVDQLENIDSVTITNAQWGYLGALDQGLTTSSNVQHANGVFTGQMVVGDSAVGVSYTSVDGLVIGDGTGNQGMVIDSANTGQGIITFSDRDWETHR